MICAYRDGYLVFAWRENMLNPPTTTLAENRPMLVLPYL
jgi:hypothetical protein